MGIRASLAATTGSKCELVEYLLEKNQDGRLTDDTESPRSAAPPAPLPRVDYLGMPAGAYVFSGAKVLAVALGT